ncbi:MAG: tetratricopeptide repeat protein [Deltaproteobacteria bacterium]|nr:tetratricopeptide repeat protein [Deltaproteobacteria bacterium]
MNRTVESSQNPDAAKFKAAKILYETGRLHEAEKLYAGFLSGNMREAGEAAKTLADIYVRTGSRKKVIAAAEKLAKRSNNREEALEISAEILSYAGFHVQAVKYLGEALGMNPSKRPLHEKIAGELLKAKKFEDAAAGFMDILDVYGGGGRNFEQVGRLFEELSRDKEAMLFYDKGIEKGEKTAQIFLARGPLKRKTGDFASAHKDSMMAVDYAGKPEEVLNGLRDSYFSVNDLKRYIEVLNRLSAKFPARDRLTVETGIILMKLGQKTDGLNLVKGVLKTTKEDPFYIYRLLLEIGEESETGKLLVEMSEMPPDRFSTDNVYEIAMSLIQNGDIEAARKFIDRLANGEESTAGNKSTAANIFYMLGKYGEALKCEKAACAQSRDGNCPLSLGRLEYLAGNVENALREFSVYAGEDAEKYDEAVNAVFSFLASRRDYETALKFTEAAGKTKESRATIFYRLKSLVILGRHQDAVGYLKDILNRQNIEFFADGISIMRHLILNGQAGGIEKLIRETGALEPLYDLWFSCTVKGVKTLTKESINSGVSELAGLLPGMDFRLGEILFDCGRYELAGEYFLDSLRGEERQFLARNLEMLFKSDAAAGKKASIREALKILGERFDDLLFVRETLADAAYSAGFYGGAAEIYKDLSKFFPDDPGLLMKIFRTCAMTDDKCDPDEAEENYVAASENGIRALETVFSIYRELRRFDEAKKAITRLSALYPANYQYLYNSLRMLILSGDGLAAKETGKKFIEASSDRTEALMDIYSLYTELGYMSDGSDLLDGIEEGDSLKYRRNYLEGIRKFRSGEIDKAKELLSLAFASGNCSDKEKYRALMPFIIAYGEEEWLRKQASAPGKKSPQGILIMAGVEIFSGNAGNAKRLMDEYAGIGFNAAYGMNLLGIAATSAGNYDLAVEIYETSLKFDPSDENIGVIIAQIGDIAGPYKDGKLSVPAAGLVSFGISLCEKILSMNPFEPSTQTYKAEFLHFLGEEKLADEIIERVFMAAPHSPTLFNNYAYVLAKQGRRLDEALNYAKKAIQLQPTQGIYYYDTLGWVHYAMGNFTEALEWIKKSEALLTERQVDTAIEVYYHLGLVYKKLDRHEDALKAFYEAARLNPLSSHGMKSLAEIKALKDGK